MKNYIDVKITVWNRLHFPDQSNMKGIADLIKEDGLNEVIDDKLCFPESETLFIQKKCSPLQITAIRIYLKGWAVFRVVNLPT